MFSPSTFPPLHNPPPRQSLPNFFLFYLDEYCTCVVISYVIVSRHSRLPRALQAKGRSAPLRHVTKNPSPQLLLFPTLTNRDSRNSFRIRSYKKWRVRAAC